MRRRILAIPALILALLPAAASAQADADRCRVQLVSANDSGGIVGNTYFASGGVRLRCLGQEVTMETDSVIAYANGDVEFLGYMRYRDTTVAIDAQRAFYRKARETWEARGNVVVRNLETGSTMRGPTVDYLRAAGGLRDSTEVYATGRPRIEYFDADAPGGVGADTAAGGPGEPYVIIADRLRSRGNALLWAGGAVQIDRSDMSARGDSMRLDTGEADDGTLLGRPVFRGLGVDSFALSGSRIDFELERRRLSYVTAAERAHLVREDWDLVADTIAIDLEDGSVEQLLAWGDSTRPDAKSDRHAVKADSVAFDTPGELLAEIRAFGAAWVGGPVDSASGDRDWVAGDTVVASFAPLPDDSASTALTRLSARQNARSFRRMEPDRPGEAASLAYVKGDVITIVMQTGGEEVVDRVEVRGNVTGVQLDAGTGRRGAAPRP